MTDLYGALGVPKNASADEIKKAYRSLARRYHPDRNPGDAAAEERFKEVQGAYDVLSDPEQRRQYDSGARPFGPGSAGGFGFEGFDLGDLFGGVFGGRAGRGGARAERGADLEAVVHLSFEDSLRGAEVRVPVEVDTACHTCGGSGAQPGTSPKVCPECGGRGVRSEAQGLFALSQPCPRCRGNGTIVEQPCSSCRGAGRERATKRYAVKIPAGARDGTRIRLSGKGEAGRHGGPPGDLYVQLHVRPHAVFSREHDDLHCEMPVSFVTAALGGEIAIPTLEGSAKIRIPAETQSGKVFRLRGKGVKGVRSSTPGDLFCHVVIETPVSLTGRQKELLREFDAITQQDSEKHNPRAKSWMDRVREFFAA